MGYYDDLKGGKSSNSSSVATKPKESSGGGYYESLKSSTVTKDTPAPVKTTPKVDPAKQKQFNETVYGGTKKVLAPANVAKAKQSVDEANKLDIAKRRLASKGPVGTESLSYEDKVKDSRANDQTRNIPVVGPILKTLDKLANKTLPAQPVLESLVTPGIGGTAALTEGAAYGLSKLLPKLANNAGGRILKTGLTEAAVGAPLGVSNVLATNPEASLKEVRNGALLGAGGGLVIGAGGKAVKEGLKKVLSRGNSARVADVIPNNVGGSAREAANATETVLPQQTELPIKTINPRTEVPISGQRANYGTQVNEGNFGEEFNQGVANRDRTYPKATNEGQIAEANRRVADFPRAEAEFHANQSPDGDHIATGYRLLQELNRTGQTQRALNVSDKLAADLTKMGQGTQAASIIKRLSPEGQLLHLQRTAKEAGKVVSVEDAKLFTELATDVQKGANSGKDTVDFLGTLDKLKAGQEVSPEELLKATAILEDAKTFIKSGKEPKLPKEVNDVRTRDKIVTFFDGAEKAALDRIKARKNNLNALPINEWADHAIVVASQIVKGTIKAETYVEDMVHLFGESVKPYAKQVYEKASKMVNASSKRISSGKLEEANDALRRLSGKVNEEKEAVKSMAEVVKKVIADAKTGVIDPEDLIKIRTMSEEISSHPTSSRVLTDEQKFIQNVKSLAKKLNAMPSEKVPTSQDNREVSSLLRQVTKLVDPEGAVSIKTPIDNQSLSDIAHDLLEMKRPDPKPRTIHEKVAEKFIKESEIRPGDIEKLRGLAKQLNELKGKSAQDADMEMQAILNKYQKASLWDRVQAVRYISMLFNTGTQLVNAGSGPLMATAGYASDLIGGLIEVAIKKSDKRTTTLYAANPLKFMARYIKNFGTGAKAGARGVSPSGITGTGDIRGLTYKSLYNPLGLLERGLGAVSKGADYATYKTVFQGELERQAKRAAKNAGVNGKEDIKNFVDKFLLDPPENAVEVADRIGKNTTFQRSDSFGGKAAEAIHRAPNGLKQVAQTIVPFVKTPINMTESAIDLTPVGLIRGIVTLAKKGSTEVDQREAIRRLGLSIVGTGGLGASGYYLREIGVITGNNESGDKNVDNLKDAAGQGKFRLNTTGLGRYMVAMLSGKGIEGAEKAAQYRDGDSQLDYNKFQPLAFPVAAGASFSENKDKGVLEQVSKATGDAGATLFSMSALKGIQDAFQSGAGATGTEKFTAPVQRIVESFLKGFSPSLLAQEATRQDNIVRQTSYDKGILKDVKDYFMSRSPWHSEKLPAKLDPFGNPVTKASGIKGAYLNPYRSQEANVTPTETKLVDLYKESGDKGVAPAPISKSVRGKSADTGQPITKPIPPEMYAKLQKKVGDLESQMISKIPDNLTPEQKAYLVDKIYEFVRKGATIAAKSQLGIAVDD